MRFGDIIPGSAVVLFAALLDFSFLPFNVALELWKRCWGGI
jgi:hypothetical protein